MTDFTRVALVSLLTLSGVFCVTGGSPTLAQPRGPAAPLFGILQSELQRNFDVLRRESTPAYFIGYTVHDERSSQIVASFGAVERSDESRGRFASVDVRVGDYTLDNTRVQIGHRDADPRQDEHRVEDPRGGPRARLLP